MKQLYLLCVTIFFLVSCNKNHSEDIVQNIINPNNEGGIFEIQIDFDGVQREFSVIFPENYDVQKEYPLVFFFHGLGGEKGFGEWVLSRISSHNDFIGVSPQGFQNSWNCGSGGVPSQQDDIAFIHEIIDLISENSSIDANCIYAMGYSNGGQFSNVLALNTDRFAAIACLSASFFEGMQMSVDDNKVSVFHLHGDADIVVPYAGGQSMNLPIVFQSVENTISYWLILNELNTNPKITISENKRFMYEYSQADNPYKVVLCRLEEVNHDISQHEYVSSMLCYEDIWTFFEQHPKTQD